VPTARKTRPQCEYPPPGPRAPGADDSCLADLSWAVPHPIRVRILRLLIEKDACVCGQLVEMLPVAQSTVSQHLKIMKDAGLIRGDVDGPKVCYCVDPVGLTRLKKLIAGL